MVERYNVERRIQVGVGAICYEDVLVVPAADYDALAGELARVKSNHEQFYDWAQPQITHYVEQKERIAALEAALLRIENHPNAKFNVAICEHDDPTIRDIVRQTLPEIAPTALEAADDPRDRPIDLDGGTKDVP